MRFLEQIARIWYAEAGDALMEYCFVFPNRRSSLFFCKYLGEAAGKPVFSPKLLTINDLMTDLSGLRPVDKIGALYTLYRNYAALMWPGEEPKESFDEFVYWGDVLLGDFDDVDKYLVDASRLFTNVSDLKEIDTDYSFLSEEQRKAVQTFWESFLLQSGRKINASETLDKKHLFRTTWKVLYPLYTAFREELAAQNLGYEGMIYRRVAETLLREGEEKEALVARLRQYRKIVFVGLNAVNACEKVLLNTIRDRLDGDFYWDFEDARTTDPVNKSSLFLRDNVTTYRSKHPLAPSLPAAQTFRTISVSSGIAQTQVAGNLLRELAAEQGFNPFETAVVLPDERLLLPMLGAVPETIQDINVTMGFPLGQSNAATFVSFLERLHRNKKMAGAHCTFYYRDVLNLLNHPFLADGDKAPKYIAEISRQNMIYVEDSFLAEGNFALVFKDVPDAASLPDYQVTILDAIVNKLSSVDREFVYHLRAAVLRLQSLAVPMTPKTYYRLLGQLIGVISIPFRGEPLSGLQIMGPLETRALDFKNIIILSVNEGVFPKRSVSGSFIPYNLRFGFSLPNYEFQDALSSYYFYRSIARAENIFLLYDSRTEGLQTGEPSRFIKQLKYHYNVPLHPCDAPIFLKTTPNAATFIIRQKTPEVMAILRERYVTGDSEGRRKPFSASALNTYLDCPVRFYYQYVERVEEADEVVEELDSGLFGSIFHKVMEELYKPYVEQELSPALINALADDDAHIKRLILEAFASEAKIHALRGKNLILNELLLTFVKKILSHDAAAAPFTLQGTEARAFAPLKLDNGDTVSLMGVLDRRDLRGGKPYILDYKTGSLNKKISGDLDKMFEPEGKERPTISLQLYLYALLALAEDSSLDVAQLSLCIYGLLNVFDKDYQLTTQTIDAASLADFQKRLKALIGEILNPEVPFEAKDPRCDYCNFKILCGK